MDIAIREFTRNDISAMTDIWNTIVIEGKAFPQIDLLTPDTAFDFFNEQTFTGVAINNNEVVGLYILHPNNIGRCGHIANASYAVKDKQQGKGIGEQLVLHSIKTAKNRGFRILQFNAVVASNSAAVHLYKKLGFTRLGIIPDGFLSKNNKYLDIIPYYIEII